MEEIKIADNSDKWTNIYSQKQQNSLNVLEFWYLAKKSNRLALG